MTSLKVWVKFLHEALHSTDGRADPYGRNPIFKIVDSMKIC